MNVGWIIERVTWQNANLCKGLKFLDLWIFIRLCIKKVNSLWAVTDDVGSYPPYVIKVYSAQCGQLLQRAAICLITIQYVCNSPFEIQPHNIGVFFLLHGIVWVEFLNKVNEQFPLMQHLWEIEQRCKWMKGFGPISRLSDAQQTQCFVYNNWHQQAFSETRPLTFLPQKALLFVSSPWQQGLGVDLVSLREWSVAKLMETRETYWAAAWALALCICLNSAGGLCHDKNTPKVQQFHHTVQAVQGLSAHSSVKGPQNDNTACSWCIKFSPVSYIYISYIYTVYLIPPEKRINLSLVCFSPA